MTTKSNDELKAKAIRSRLSDLRHKSMGIDAWDNDKLLDISLELISIIDAIQGQDHGK